MIEPLMQTGRARSDFLEVFDDVSECASDDSDVQHTLKHRVDHFECLVNLFSNFRASQDDLARNEDEENNLGLDHSVDETREQLGLIRAEVVMAGRKTFQTNGELDVTGADNVLDLEVGKLGIETKLLDDTSVLARCKLRVVLRLCTSNHHLP